MRFRYEDLDLYVPEDERPKSGWVFVYVAAALALVAVALLGIALFVAVAS